MRIQQSSGMEIQANILNNYDQHIPASTGKGTNKMILNPFILRISNKTLVRDEDSGSGFWGYTAAFYRNYAKSCLLLIKFVRVKPWEKYIQTPFGCSAVNPSASSMRGLASSSIGGGGEVTGASGQSERISTSSSSSSIASCTGSTGRVLTNEINKCKGQTCGFRGPKDN